MGDFIDITGKKFGHLTVIERVINLDNFINKKTVRFLCKCDCGNEKICESHPLRMGWVKSCGCNLKFTEEEDEKRCKIKLIRSCHIDPTTGCWEWKKSTCGGYGMVTYKRRQIKAHRASWIIYKGKIPEKMWVLHKCDNRKCINPDHLFLGLPIDNTRDMIKKKRDNFQGTAGIKNRLAKFTEEEIFQIRLEKKKGNTYEKLAKKYDTTKNTIYRICKRLTWKHLHDPE